MGTNLLMVLVLVVMFYVLLIMPQQRRMKDHGTMLKGLKKGDSIVTAGGLVGVIDKADDGSDEVVVDLGSGVKVTALRSTIQAKNDPRLKPLPAANTNKSAPKKVPVKPAPKSKK
jgi:preprotein translocase subunit YajC